MDETAEILFHITEAIKHFGTEVECVTASKNKSLVGKYLNPIDYCEHVLHIELTDDQKEICHRVCEPPYRVLVRSAHSTGKTYLCGALTSWFFDTFDPSFAITTAPTRSQVEQALWKEIRRLRTRARTFDPDYDPAFSGPIQPKLMTRAEHVAIGMTATASEGFQGKHGPAIMVIMDEATAIKPEFFEAADSMMNGPRFCSVYIYNPIDPTAQVHKEESHDGYHTPLVLSCLDHPNIKAELRGDPPPIRDAVRLAWVKDMLKKGATPIPIADATPMDVCLDETKIGGIQQWWRPGPMVEARVLARWPSMSVCSVWSETAFDRCLGERAQQMPDDGPLQIGCDIARFGDDSSTFFIRKGGVALAVESHNGWTGHEITQRCKQLAGQYGAKYGIHAKKIPIVVDEIGMGGIGVVDHLRPEGWMAIGINVQKNPPALKEAGRYPNLRSFLWFEMARAAEEYNVSFAKLPRSDVQAIKDDVMRVQYTIDTRGRHVVESKDDMKSRTGKSPDVADSAHLAYLVLQSIGIQVSGRIAVQT